MADEETKVLLRDLLAAKREEIELLRRSNELYERHLSESSTRDREAMELNRLNTEKYKSQAEAHEKAAAEAAALNRTSKIANIIRAMGILFIGMALFYLVVAEIQRH
jgi:hypothetical protein